MNNLTLRFILLLVTIQSFSVVPCVSSTSLSFPNDDETPTSSTAQNTQQRTTTTPTMIKAIRHANVSCQCGKVRLSIDAPSALRFVCYSKDCRGYVQTLNEQTQKQGLAPAAVLDPWGGVDFTQIYPSDITMTQGQDEAHVQVVLIRPESPIRRVYASCCGTPLFDIGSASAMVYSQLLPDQDLPDIRFRIMGRHALSTADKTKPPGMSWGIPWLSWPFVMGRRMGDKSKMEPNPIDISQPKVMENFHQG